MQYRRHLTATAVIHQQQRREYSYLCAVLADFAIMMISAFLLLVGLH
jgi:hypothetical protein